MTEAIALNCYSIDPTTTLGFDLGIGVPYKQADPLGMKLAYLSAIAGLISRLPILSTTTQVGFRGYF
jgi:hypothetical protein